MAFAVRLLRRTSVLAALLGLARFTSAAPATIELLDRDLSQWDTYLSYRHQPGYRGELPVDANGTPIQPVGYNHDPAGVFSVVEREGEWVLRISGEIYGCLFTREEFSNYRLTLKVKWGGKKWPPREALLRDSGILYHSQGESGVDYWRAWMLSQEFQIMEGHMGDYWNIAQSAVDIRAFLPEGAMNSIASARQSFLPFGAGDSVAGFCLRSSDEESPSNEWTELELICFEGQSLHLVNGRVVMILRNSRHLTPAGDAQPLTRGRIQLQSEAAEVFFKRIRLQPLEALPAEHRHWFD